MIYLAANNSRVWHLRAEGFPLGWMMSPAGWRAPARGQTAMPYALDNGLFHPFGKPPKHAACTGLFLQMLDKAAAFHQPMFAVAPDVPYHGERSLNKSRAWLPILRRRYPGLPLALAVQDGMEPNSLDGWDWVFIAGSTGWKWRMFALWVREAHARGMKAHVARVNTWSRINQCVDADADSADGTGIFRGDKTQLRTVMDALVQKSLFDP